MEIVVIDNISWKVQYNEIVLGIEVEGLLPTFVIEAYKTEFLNNDYIFLINIHCCINSGKNGNKNYLLQDQAGVIFYRHLLNLYTTHGKQLKAAFFSPLPLEILLDKKNKPENEIIRFYPFIEIPGNWDYFLKKISDFKTWYNFNTASENLLSGWALSEKVKTNLANKKIVFVDDETDCWATCLGCVINTYSNGSINFIEYNKQNAPEENFSLNKLPPSFRDRVRDADLVVLDLYLEENHDSNFLLNPRQVEELSGFKLFHEIKGSKEYKGINKGISIVFHSTSNKIQYYKIFEAYGVDNWLVKESRPFISQDEKRQNYLIFKKVIENFTSGQNAEIYSLLKIFWARINGIKNLNATNWWFENTDDAIAPNKFIRKANKKSKYIIDSILSDSYMALRSLLNRESLYSDSIGSNDINFTASSIASALGKIFEFLELDPANKSLNVFYKYLFCIRNAASHFSDYLYFTITDTIIYFHYWLCALESQDLYISELFRTTSAKELLVQGTTKDSYKFRLFYICIQYYNYSRFNRKDKYGNLLLYRIKSLFKAIDNRALYIELSKSEELIENVCARWNRDEAITKVILINDNDKYYLTNG